MLKSMRCIDSHTEGEPTRLIVEGGPALGAGSLAERVKVFARDFDHIRSFAVNEPRGHDAVVGGLLVEPHDKTCAAGVIFFNNVGFIGMCGHGSIGTAVTLAHLGRIGPGVHRLETPVGVVTVDLKTRNEVTIENVPSYRLHKSVSVTVPGLGKVTGDVAWGGNWFFLTNDTPCTLDMAHIGELTRAAGAIKAALVAAAITGTDGAAVDHIELFGPPGTSSGKLAGNSRSFVLCPGGAYDRSPCGTGTSAKLACLAADGKLAAGTDWVQESVIGSRFTARYRLDDARVTGGHNRAAVIPSITGRAYVTADVTLLRDASDPFADGLRADGVV
jgi:4-hydroxyproline epimerase